MANVILNEKTWIRAKYVKVKKLDDLYVHNVFNESNCQKCEFLADRPSDVCMACPSFEGTLKMWSEKKHKGKTWIGVPSGDKKAIKIIAPKINELVVKDKRAVEKREDLAGLVLTKPLYDYQVEAVEKLIHHAYGCLLSAPRSGKTVMSVDITRRLRCSTLILAHQHALLSQFITAFEDFTNIRALEEKLGKKLIGICEKEEDYKKYAICLSTYQIFISEAGQKKLKRLKNNWGLVIIDEIHRGAANCFSSVINTINSKYRFGVTGTYERKDGKETIVNKIVGPVLHETSVDELKPKVQIVRTGTTSRYAHKIWVYAMRYLERDKDRHELIVKHAVASVKKGRSVLIPVTFTSHADSLVKDINKHFKGNPAIAFTGRLPKGEKRDAVLDKLRNRKYRVMVGMRNMLLGINIPCLDTIFEISPISNSPNLIQEIKRITTPFDGKKQPLVKYFVDDIQLCISCFRNMYFNVLVKEGFIISKETQKKANELMGGSKSSSPVSKKKSTRTRVGSRF